MKHGECPEKSVWTSSSRRGVLKVSTWAKLVQLNFLKRFLSVLQLSSRSCPEVEDNDQ